MWLLLQTAFAVAAALVSPRSRSAALALGAAAFFVAPWLAGPIALVRGLSALWGFTLFIRVIDIARSSERWSARHRILHVFSFVDSRTLRRAPPRLDVRAFARALAWGALSVGGWYVAHSPRHLARWGGGLVLVYSAIESGWAFAGAAYRVLGFVGPRLHDWPLASLSVAELWGKRWARPVSAWLRDTFFRPLARRGHPLLGVLLGFVVSGIGHAYPVLVAIDLPAAAMMFAFFVVQGAFVTIEGRLGMARRSRAARRAWTVTVMIASSPLFVEPAMRVLDAYFWKT
jgi:hypothetical protein